LAGNAIPAVKEVGPYVYAKYTEYYDVSFRSDQMDFKISYNWEFDDKRTDRTLDANTDVVTVENLGYQALMVAALSETTLFFLVAGCTPENIENNKYTQAWIEWQVAGGLFANKPDTAAQCKWTYVGDEAYYTGFDADGDPNCGCCIPNAIIDNVPANSDGSQVTTKEFMSTNALNRNGPKEEEIAMCEDLVSPSWRIWKLVSQLSILDRGFVVDATATLPTTTTAIFHTISVFELAFGYPSAVIGQFLVKFKPLDYPGKNGDALSIALSQDPTVAAIGGYTTSVSQMCYKNCTAADAFAALLADTVPTLDDIYATRCDGFTPKLSAPVSASLPYYTGEKSCSATASGFMAANFFCGLQEDAAIGNTVTSQSIGCTCADGSVPTLTDELDASGNFKIARGCCLIAGNTRVVGDSTDAYPEINSLIGWGCTAPIPGVVADNWMTNQETSRQYQKVIDNIKSDRRKTGCKEGELSETGDQLIFNGETEYKVWSTPGGDFVNPTPGMMKAFAEIVETHDPTIAPYDSFLDLGLYSSQVDGKPGLQIPAQGIHSRGMFSAELNDNTAELETFDLYETNSKLALPVELVGESDVLEIPTQRYGLNEKTLWKEFNPTNENFGVGVKGGFASLAYSKGVPVGLSQPNFFNGDNELFDAVNIYDTEGVLLTKEVILADAENYQTYFDIEMSTGKTFRANQRLGVNSYFQKCNVVDTDTNENQPECLLSFNYELETYPESIFNVVSIKLKVANETIVPLYRIDRNAALKEEQADALNGLIKILKMSAFIAIGFNLAGLAVGLHGFKRMFYGVTPSAKRKAAGL
jgi:hypothetical protein